MTERPAFDVFGVNPEGKRVLIGTFRPTFEEWERAKRHVTPERGAFVEWAERYLTDRGEVAPDDWSYEHGGG